MPRVHFHQGLRHSSGPGTSFFYELVSLTTFPCVSWSRKPGGSVAAWRSLNSFASRRPLANFASEAGLGRSKREEDGANIKKNTTSTTHVTVGLPPAIVVMLADFALVSSDARYCTRAISFVNMSSWARQVVSDCFNCLTTDRVVECI